MNISNSLRNTQSIEAILYPKYYFFKGINRYIIASILALSQQYSDPAAMKSAELQSNIRWHTINEIFTPTFEECNSSNQLQ